MIDEKKARGIVKNMIEKIPDPHRKKALRYYLKLLKAHSIIEKKVYKARILTFYAEGLKDKSPRERKELCRRLHEALRAI